MPPPTTTYSTCDGSLLAIGTPFKPGRGSAGRGALQKEITAGCAFISSELQTLTAEFLRHTASLRSAAGLSGRLHIGAEASGHGRLWDIRRRSS